MISNKYLFIGRKPHVFYKGLLIKADLNTHESILWKMQSNNISGKILDFGCGEGALSQRLLDHGFQVISVDKDIDQYKARGGKSIKLDFDSKSSLQNFLNEYDNYFDVVLSIEVIEHVENHFEMMRMLKKLVKKDGLIFVSTPNISSWLSRLTFLRKGEFHQFSDRDYFADGHITPLSDFEMNIIAKTLSLKLISKSPTGTLPPLYFASIALFFRSIIGILLRPFMKGKLNGWGILYIFKK